MLALFGVFGAGRPAWVVSGTDTTGCYAFSDTIAPRDANAPTFSFIDISATGTQIALGDDEVSGPLPIEHGAHFHTMAYGGAGPTVESATIPRSSPEPQRPSGRF